MMHGHKKTSLRFKRRDVSEGVELTALLRLRLRLRLCLLGLFGFRHKYGREKINLT